jgi:hypothetical protein
LSRSGPRRRCGRHPDQLPGISRAPFPVTPDPIAPKIPLNVVTEPAPVQVLALSAKNHCGLVLVPVPSLAIAFRAAQAVMLTLSVEQLPEPGAP